ncbi:MAG TPA: hypothetical protein VGI74_02970 [Streptosporangiaceae bacterium]|jgi:hypothetical protein
MMRIRQRLAALWLRIGVPREVVILRVVMAIIGRVMVGIPIGSEPAWALTVSDIGLVAVLAAALAPREVSGGLGALAAMAAVIECASAKLGMAALAGEGLLLLVYLLLLDAPGRPAGADLRRWLLRLTPAALAGLAAAGVLLLALSAAATASPWVALAGLAAAVAAYLIVLPLRPGPRRQRR